MRHRVEQVTKDGAIKAICTYCGAASPPGTRAEAQDWEDQHRSLADRAMAHLRARNPSVKDQYTYYRERAADPHESAGNRVLWRLLADGLAARVGPVEKDTPLDIEVTYTPRHRRDRTDRP